MQCPDGHRSCLRPQRATAGLAAGTHLSAFLAMAAVLLITGCAPATTVPSPASGGSTTTAESSAPSTLVPGTVRPSETSRFLFSCTFINKAPPMSFYRLESVWASGDYTRISSCTVRFMGPEPYEPSSEEARVISLAGVDARSPDALETYLNLARLCTRISDEAGPDGFAAQPDATLEAANQLCPHAPQAKIILAWAGGERFGDGSHVVGEDHIVGEDVAAGRYAPVRPVSDQCQWSIATATGQTKQSGGASRGTAGVDLVEGDVFASENCGIWWRLQ